MKRTIRDLNNQLIEEKDEHLAELREELDLTQSKINSMKMDYNSLQETLADYENTIKKFRDLVANLRQEIQDLRSANQYHESSTNRTEGRELRVQEPSVRPKGVHSSHRYGTAPTGSGSVPDTHLIPVKVHARGLFSRGGDHDAIQVLLFLPRIIKKCEIIERQIAEKYQPMDMNGDQQTKHS